MAIVAIGRAVEAVVDLVVLQVLDQAVDGAGASCHELEIVGRSLIAEQRPIVPLDERLCTRATTTHQALAAYHVVGSASARTARTAPSSVARSGNWRPCELCSDDPCMSVIGLHTSGE
mgnify:FL=1